MRLNPTWQDVTSFSRSDTERHPRSFHLELGIATLIVTRHMHFAKDQWVWYLQGGSPRALKTYGGPETSEAARIEAQRVIDDKLSKALEKLRRIA